MFMARLYTESLPSRPRQEALTVGRQLILRASAIRTLHLIVADSGAIAAVTVAVLLVSDAQPASLAIQKLVGFVIELLIALVAEGSRPESGL